ncbi:MAG: hypothetical protein GF346_04230 [Candidatus Eisenbacteria bacterium]|nr:hypothetical protein [Candidatus Latescibacterota bacterium]MBD3301634.1 hypothetical protein [Candidatus Eisenbacteria bacterium]
MRWRDEKRGTPAVLAGSFAALLAAGGLAGCGPYSFTGSSLPAHIETLAVPIFENETLELEIADEVTEAVTQRFLSDNRLRIVGESRADAILEGTVTSYENKVYNYSADETPLDYIVVLRLTARFRDLGKNRDLWNEEAMTASAVYSVTAEGDRELTTEEEARERAIAELAEDFLARTMEQW